MLFCASSLAKPSDRAGGAFYIGARVLGAGTSRITDTDVARLDDYVGAMTDLSKRQSFQRSRQNTLT